MNVSILTAYLLLVLLNSFDFETEVRKLAKFGQRTGKSPVVALQNEKETKSKTKSKIKTKKILEPKKVQKPDYFKIIIPLIIIGLVFVPCTCLCSLYMYRKCFCTKCRFS